MHLQLSFPLIVLCMVISHTDRQMAEFVEVTKQSLAPFLDRVRVQYYNTQSLSPFVILHIIHEKRQKRFRHMSEAALALGRMHYISTGTPTFR